jgi:hypothetical protein
VIPLTNPYVARRPICVFAAVGPHDRWIQACFCVSPLAAAVAFQLPPCQGQEHVTQEKHMTENIDLMTDWLWTVLVIIWGT